MKLDRCAVLVVVSLVACGGGGGGGNQPTPASVPTATPATLPSPVAASTITITAQGVQPSSIVVAPGTRVTFVNQDALSHDMSSDPHPTHTSCPALNEVGVLSPGRSGQTGALTIVRSCGFHDHGQPDNNRLQGSITVR